MKTRLIVILILASLIAIACNQWIDTNLNVDPTSPMNVPGKTVLPTTQAGIAYVIGGDVNRFVGCITQQFFGADRQHAGIYQYIIKEDDLNNAWNTMYAGPMMDLKFLMTWGKENNSPYYSGIAKVLMAVSLGMWTDLIGDIPYSQAFKGIDNLKPGYDTQEQIYNSIQSLLDEAITDLQSTSSVFKPTTDDMMYGGSTSKWIKAAYTLKARFYLHLKEYDKALTALANGFTSNDDDLQFNFTDKETEANPLYQFDQQRNDIRMGPKLMEMMNTFNDPRRPFFANTNENGEYDNTSPLGPFYASINSPVPFITFVEAKFIEAECQLAKGNPDLAYQAYQDAIMASMAKVGISDNDAENYWNQTSVSVGSTNLTLQNIIDQKYIACFFSSEVYTDWRRTNFPTLTPVSGNQIPRRFPYPQSERTFNLENLLKAAPNAGDPNFKFQKLWWDRTFWNP